MDRIKTIVRYFVWILLFIVISEFLIYVGLNATYDNITQINKMNEISIYQAEATKVNGRIRGIINNQENENIDLSGKYVKFTLYSERDIVLGEKYILIDLEDKTEQTLELLFRIEDVDRYKMEIVDERPEVEEFTLFPSDPTTQRIIFSTAYTLLIFL